MDYLGPQPADLADVYALNRALLDCLRSERCGQMLRSQLAPPLRPLIPALTDLQIMRLAALPFLLLTVRERDDHYWDQLLTDDPNQDLFATTAEPRAECDSIVAATIGFMWQLARRNPYTARLVSGATLYWCEQLAAHSLFELLQRAVKRRDLLGLRLSDNDVFWKRLLGPGLSSQPDIRNSAHLCALQTVLTADNDVEFRRLRTAACRTSVPTFGV